MRDETISDQAAASYATFAKGGVFADVARFLRSDSGQDLLRQMSKVADELHGHANPHGNARLLYPCA